MKRQDRWANKYTTYCAEQFYNDMVDTKYGTNSVVYITKRFGNNKRYAVIFTDKADKYFYYDYALFYKFKYIPKIYALQKDAINNIYYICRDVAYPVIDKKKLKRIEKIKFNLANPSMRKFGIDPICDELLKFHQCYSEYEFDFSTDWIMQDKRGKLVICDPFRRIEK